jgi:hypothetical protein
MSPFALSDTDHDKEYGMNTDIKRRMVYGVLSLVLSSLAAWVAGYLTNKILGEPDD